MMMCAASRSSGGNLLCRARTESSTIRDIRHGTNLVTSRGSSLGSENSYTTSLMSRVVQKLQRNIIPSPLHFSLCLHFLRNSINELRSVDGQRKFTWLSIISQAERPSTSIRSSKWRIAFSLGIPSRSTYTRYGHICSKNCRTDDNGAKLM